MSKSEKTFPDPPKSQSPPRGASVFASRLYSERGIHIGAVDDFLIQKTDVDLFIDRLNSERREQISIIDGRIGDPTKYPGIEPYPGFKRIADRYSHFNPASVTAGYLISGDPVLKERLRNGRYRTSDKVPVPPDVMIWMTPGVAGALRLITQALLLPPNHHLPEISRLEGIKERINHNGDIEEVRGLFNSLLDKLEAGITRHNIVIPKWTYVTHFAETSLAHGDAKMCKINENTDGQVDLADIEQTINANTRAVLFATVGNPLSVAMKPEVFDEIIEIVGRKMVEFNHPIVVIADTIYEPYRKNPSERIDPIQRGLRLDLGVPVIDMSSFSKMMAIPGERVGYFRLLWDPSSYPDECEDFKHAIANIYGPSLGGVNRKAQIALGVLYQSVDGKLPVEEELAPLASVLTALKELTDLKGKGDSHVLFPEEITEATIRQLGVDPHVWFTSSAVAKRTRKLADVPLTGGYNIEMGTTNVEKIVGVLESAGLVEVKNVAVKMADLKGMTRNVIFDGISDHDIQLTVNEIDPDSALSKRTLDITLTYVRKLLAGLTKRTDEDSGETVNLMFCRLSGEIPNIVRDDREKLSLYGISRDKEWGKIADRCKLSRENQLFEGHKEYMRKTVYDRVWYFAQGIDNLKKEGIGVSLHPAYYNSEGELDHNRFNAFYILWKFDKLSNYSRHASQALQVAELCVENGRRIIANVPAESFVPYDQRDNDASYLRIVALQTKQDMDEMFETIRIIDRELH